GERSTLPERHIGMDVFEQLSNGSAAPPVEEILAGQRRPAHLSGLKRISVADSAVLFVYLKTRLDLADREVAEAGSCVRSGGIRRCLARCVIALREHSWAGQKH